MMSTADMFSMLALGLLGTGHCIGMCGPLVIAFPARCGGFAAHFLYHLGRLTTYVVMGGILGALGAGFRMIAAGSGYLAWMAALQVGFSVVAAVFLLTFGLMQIDVLHEPAWLSLATPVRIPGFTAALRAAQRANSRFALYVVGLMLGLLPCGLSYAAFARVLPLADPAGAGFLCLAFGLGTVPGLALVGTVASKMTRRYRIYSEFLSGLLMIGMALSLFADAIQALIGRSG
ncbi:sulfite exporter TauE/SafE family protein [Desulfoferrobacter suflitae]|uniref:sulfite exporter TauE/SafE family protein n=1 Tax=Desulfoferrobacter suflitae TaxID=2865782 RepID=UPI002164DE81|nr:sulfite exporter TauE/SafE family protein [Desulfoferrobacter suflitae]MCK8603597.1 sulfite exporter TauE/SafE family protein [Desulfoferrobacter suflitae]